MQQLIQDLAHLQAVCKLDYPELAKALDKSKRFVEDLKIIRLFLVKNLEKSGLFFVKSYIDYIDALINISAAVESSVRAGKPSAVPLSFFDELTKSASQVVFDAREMDKKLELREGVPIITSPQYILDTMVGLNGLYYKLPKAQKAGDPKAAEYETHYKKILANSFNELGKNIQENLKNLNIPGNKDETARLKEILRREAIVLDDISKEIAAGTISTSALLVSILGGLFLTFLWLILFPITLAAGIPWPRPSTIIVGACSILARRAKEKVASFGKKR